MALPTQNAELTAKAKAMRDEYRKEWNFMHWRQRSGFVRRANNLAKKVSISNQTHAHAMMYLDHIALWTDNNFDYQS